MLHSFIIPQEITANIQEQIKILEECLHDPNVQDGVMAELAKINNRLTSLSDWLDDISKFQEKANKLSKLGKELVQKVEHKEPAILLFIKYVFLERKIIDDYWYLFRYTKRENYMKYLTLSSIDFYKKISSGIGFENLHHDEKYVLKETLKHEIQSLLKASLLINALSENEIKELDLGDMTPQESETMLISLASTKKWDWVYRNLA